jgi:hypothetical protein
MSVRILTSAALAATAMLLAACGGGGDSGPPPFGTAYDGARAFENLLTGTASWTVTGRGSDGRDYQATLGVAPGARGAYPLTPAAVGRSSVQTTSLRQIGGATASTTRTLYFPDAVALPNGIRNDDGSCSSVTSSQLPSAQAGIGTGGALLATTDHATCAGSPPPARGSSSVDWSIESHGNAGFFCLTSTSRDLVGSVLSTETDCFEIDSAGTLGPRAIVRVDVPGVIVLEMTN